MIIRLCLSLGLFVISMIFGYLLGRRKVIEERLAKDMVRFVVKRFSPLVLWLSFWRIDFSDLSVFLLPIIGFIVAVSTLLPSWLYVRMSKMPGSQAGVFITSALFSNLGFLGAFVAFALLGEVAFGLATLYLMFFNPTFYFLGFSFAKRFGEGSIPSSSADAYRDELRLYPFIGICLGLLFSLAKIPRPDFLASVNSVLIPIDTAIYLTAIGSQLHMEWLRRWLKPCFAMSLIKFVYSPLVALGLVYVFRIEGMPRFVVLLQAAMPIGISSLMLSLLFDLDHKLASALWFFTTLASVPWLWFYIFLIK